MSPDVSVVIPTCNRLDLLGPTLEAVLRQTTPFRAVIVVDNGAQDASSVTARFGDRVSLITLPAGSGVQRARNAGIRAAPSPWVATLDDDDHYRADFLETVAAAIMDGRADIVFTDHVKHARGRRLGSSNFASAPQNYWDGVSGSTESPCWSFVGSFPISRILYFVPFYPSTMIIKRELFESLGGYDPRVNGIATEDIEFLVRALNVGQLAVVWEELVDYHIHSTNNSGNFDRQRIGRWKVFEFIHRHGEGLPAAFLTALAENLPKRRRDVYDFSFHKRRFSDLAEVASLLAADDWTLSRRVYRAVAAAPAAVRDPVSRLVSAPARVWNLRRRSRPKTLPPNLRASSGQGVGPSEVEHPSTADTGC